MEKENPAQVFFCEFGGIFRNPFFIEHLWWNTTVSMSTTKSLQQVAKFIQS